MVLSVNVSELRRHNKCAFVRLRTTQTGWLLNHDCVTLLRKRGLLSRQPAQFVFKVQQLSGVARMEVKAISDEAEENSGTV